MNQNTLLFLNLHFFTGLIVAFLELDDIIYNIQKFGGASTYWTELTSRLGEFVPGDIVHTTAAKFMRLHSPRSTAKVFHSSHFRVSSSPSVKNVTTIHDLIYEKGLGGGLGKYVNLYERKKSVMRADAIICISESTRRDLYEYYGDVIGSTPVHVIYHGCTRLPTRSTAQIFGLDRPEYANLHLSSGQFFIYVGGRSGYKNFELLLKAFVAGNFSNAGFLLICTGSAFNEHERALIDDLKLSQCVVSIGFVDSSTLTELYGVARALVYPSSYEGFGLPPLEAMAAGCPVICANASSLPEVVGDSGILIDAGSAEQLTEAMRSVLVDDTRAHYVQSGLARAMQFDWQKTASEYAGVYRSLAAF